MRFFFSCSKKNEKLEDIRSLISAIDKILNIGVNAIADVATYHIDR